MKAISAAENTVLISGNRATHFRVKVDSDGAGTFVDLTNLEGRDWVEDVGITDGVDSPLRTSVITLVREFYKLSASPLVANSKLNVGAKLLEVARRIRVETAVVGIDGVPADSDFETDFEGEVDKLDPGGDASVVKLSCRDKGGELADTFIETQTTHGGASIESTIQDLIDTHVPARTQNISTVQRAANVSTIKTVGEHGLGVGDKVDVDAVDATFDITGATITASTLETFSYAQVAGAVSETADAGTISHTPTLLTPVTPSFVLSLYSQSKESVLDAIRKLTNMIAWDVRYRWDNTTSRFRLTLFAPDRTPPSTVRTFGPSEYLSISQLSVSRQRIRNVIRIVYTDAGTGLRTTLQSPDGASITRYGRRFMEIQERSSSQIDSAAEASDMAGRILSDLAEPEADHAVVMRYFGKAQLTDFYTFSANGIHYDSDQDFAVVRLQHRLTKTSKRTTMQTRGKPSLGVARWLALDGRPGVAPNADFIAPATPVTVTLTEEKGGLIIEYTVPTEDDWAFTEVHVQGPVATKNIQTVARTSNVATIVTTRPHGMETGDTADVDAVDATFDDATAVVTVTADDTFTYANTGGDLGATADAGTVDQVDFDPEATTRLIARGRSDRFEIFGLVPGATYQVKVIVVDLKGNRATVTTLTTQATIYVSPIHVNADERKTNLILNGELKIWTPPTAAQRTAFPPDRIEVGEEISFSFAENPDAWGSGGSNWVFHDTVNNSGETSIRLKGQGAPTGSPAFRTDFQPVQEDLPFQIEALVQADDVAAFIFFNLEYYSIAKVKLFTSLVILRTPSAANVWDEFTQSFRNKPGVRFIRLVFVGNSPTPGDFVWVDRVGMREILPHHHHTVDPGSPNAVSLVSGVFTQIIYPVTRVSGAFGWDAPTGQVTLKETGVYAFTASINVKGLKNNKATKMAMFRNGVNEVSADLRFNRSGGNADIAVVVSASAYSCLKNDVIDFRCFHDDGGPLVYADTEPEFNFVTMARIA